MSRVWELGKLDLCNIFITRFAGGLARQTSPDRLISAIYSKNQT
jgi:hypothetical protein